MNHGMGISSECFSGLFGEYRSGYIHLCLLFPDWSLWYLRDKNSSNCNGILVPSKPLVLQTLGSFSFHCRKCSTHVLRIYAMWSPIFILVFQVEAEIGQISPFRQIRNRNSSKVYSPHTEQQQKTSGWFILLRLIVDAIIAQLLRQKLNRKLNRVRQR